jgi:hypothetical protein
MAHRLWHKRQRLIRHDKRIGDQARPVVDSAMRTTDTDGERPRHGMLVESNGNFERPEAIRYGPEGARNEAAPTYPSAKRSEPTRVRQVARRSELEDTAVRLAALRPLQVRFNRAARFTK